MSDNLRTPGSPEPHEGREQGIESTSRICPACGSMYVGAFHQDCPSSGPTLKKAPSAESSIDDLPAEAKPFDKEISRQLNQYLLVRQVGRGGMGAVWKAWDRNLTRWVAVKFLLAHDEPDIARFRREAKLAARLRHPNIAAIYEVGTAPSTQPGVERTHYLAMEFIEGQSLAETKLPIPELVEIFVKVTQGIEAAHRGGVIHRDLKPQNVMVTPEQWPYVMDFGLAKALQGDSSLSVSGSVMGTPAYMPPEQAEGRLNDIDARSDVYSLGATMYAVLAGRPPFNAASALEILSQVVRQEPAPLRSINPQVPAPLEAVIRKCMAKRSADRYASVADLARDLQRAVSKESVAAFAPTLLAPTPAPAAAAVPATRKKSRVGLVLSLVAGFLILFVGAAGLLLTGGGEPAPVASSTRETPHMAAVKPVASPPVAAPTEPPKAEPVPVKPEPPPVAVAPKPEPPKVDPAKPALEPAPVVVKKPEPPPPPPEKDPDEAEWKQLQPLLGFETWAQGDDGVAVRANQLLARSLPKGAKSPAADAPQWLQAEIGRARASLKQGQRSAEQQQTLSRKLVAWCDMIVRATREIPALQDAGKAAQQAKSEVEAQNRGSFTLKIGVSPFAQITRMTCDGRAVAYPKHETPIVMNNLGFGAYEIELTNPDIGVRAVKIAAADLKDGKTYQISGKMEDKELKVRESP